MKISEFKRLRRLIAGYCVVDLLYTPIYEEEYVLIPLVDNGATKIVKHGFNVTECCLTRRSLRGLRLRDIVEFYVDDELVNDIPSSYDIVGDIVILPPLPRELVEHYRCIIGQALKLIHPRIRAIYVRSKTVGEYRVRPLELIWGEHVEHTIYKEHGVRFYVIPERVYINPSLSIEHLRLTELVGNSERVLDMFAGIGGFTLNIAVRRKTSIVAVDINPWAILCLLNSIRLNRKSIQSNILVFNTDSHMLPLFLRDHVFNHIIMNLPLYSLEFLNEAFKLVKKNGFIHIYIVGRSKDEVYRIFSKRIDSLEYGCRDYEVVKVLEYAPYKYIYRITCLAV